MPAQWTADVIGEMHLYGITAKALAAEIGWNDKYLSTVLNGHRTPKNAEAICKEGLARICVKQGKHIRL